MKLIDRITIRKEVFTDRGVMLPTKALLERFASVGGWGWPLPSNIHIYYFFVEDANKMIVEYYMTGDE